MSQEPLATIVVTPRERFSFAIESLRSIYAGTDPPFELVYVDAGSPASVQRQLAAAARQHGFRLLRDDRYLAPNQARNLGLAEVRTRYVAFIDNDVLVAPGWLTRLVACAEETGAWVVGPLTLVGRPGSRAIHLAGGDLGIRDEPGGRTFWESHRHAWRSLDEVEPSLRRQPCGFAEFHCMLVRAEAFAALGPLDEQLMGVNEHLDLCLEVRRAGHEVYVEPASVVTYVTPARPALADLPFFLRRWSDAWARASDRRFSQKWRLAPGGGPDMVTWARRYRLRTLARLLLGARAASGVADAARWARRLRAGR